MKIKFKLKGKWKSISLYFKNKEILIRYWGGLKFDYVTLSNPI